MARSSFSPWMRSSGSARANAGSTPSDREHASPAALRSHRRALSPALPVPSGTEEPQRAQPTDAESRAGGLRRAQPEPRDARVRADRGSLVSRRALLSIEGATALLRGGSDLRPAS